MIPKLYDWLNEKRASDDWVINSEPQFGKKDLDFLKDPKKFLKSIKIKEYIKKAGSLGVSLWDFMEALEILEIWQSGDMDDFDSRSEEILRYVFKPDFKGTIKVFRGLKDVSGRIGEKWQVKYREYESWTDNISLATKFATEGDEGVVLELEIEPKDVVADLRGISYATVNSFHKEHELIIKTNKTPIVIDYMDSFYDDSYEPERTRLIQRNQIQNNNIYKTIVYWWSDTQAYLPHSVINVIKRSYDKTIKWMAANELNSKIDTSDIKNYKDFYLSTVWFIFIIHNSYGARYFDDPQFVLNTNSFEGKNDTVRFEVYGENYEGWDMEKELFVEFNIKPGIRILDIKATVSDKKWEKIVLLDIKKYLNKFLKEFKIHPNAKNIKINWV